MMRKPPIMDVDVRRAVVLRLRVSGGAFLVYLAYAVIDLWKSPHTGLEQAVGLVLIAAFVGIYLGPFPEAMDGTARRRGGVVLSMVAVTIVYLVLDGAGGLVFSPYLVVVMIVLMPPRAALVLGLSLGAAVTFLPQYVGAWEVHGQQWSIGGPTMVLAFVMLGIRSSATNRIALSKARADIEALATEQERLRIARDLHDILGHSLTTLALKADLAAKLSDRDATAARREMEAVADLARQALGDVRSTVAGYRDVSLVSELVNARQVLSAAAIEAELPATTEELDGDLHVLFGWVVREGVTNVVRHSNAHHVWILLGKRSIDIVDDGAGGTVGSGRGLAGLAERVAERGGTVSAGPVPGAPGFRLHVEVLGP